MLYIYIYYCTIYLFRCLFLGGTGKQRKSRIQFVHKPGLGKPTSSTPNQQPAQTMPQFGERATLGPEALSGGGHTPYKSSVIHEFSPLDWSCGIIQYEHRQYSIHPRTEWFSSSFNEGIQTFHVVRMEPNSYTFN